MSEKTDTAVDTPPSLDLAFDWVKDVLINQSHTADALEAKASTLFSVATVILGIGLSAGVLSLHGVIRDHVNLWLILFSGLTLISYAFIIGFAIDTIRLRRYETLDNPIEIRKWFWDMKPTQFKIELLSHLEDSYTNNEAILIDKAKTTRRLVAATAGEMMFLVMALVLTL